MRIEKYYDYFTGDRYTVILADGVVASFNAVLSVRGTVMLILNGVSTTTLFDSAAERFLTEWQRVTVELVRTPVDAEDF